MTESNPHVQFWNHVLYAAEAMDAASSAEARSIALAQVVTLTEAFGEQSDPVENFEAFVVLRLCNALQRCLEESDAGT
jgi:hypothetical protein